jgi:leucine dehydrogenase
MSTHPENDAHESVLFAHDAATGQGDRGRAQLGAGPPAFGGCRMYPYTDEAQALADVLRLSKGMTHKAG